MTNLQKLSQRSELKIILVGLFLIGLSLFWLPNIMFFNVQKETAVMLINTGNDFSNEINKIINDPKNINDNKKSQLIKGQEKLNFFLTELKRERVDSVPLIGYAIGLIAILMTTMYILSGLYFLKHSKRAYTFLKWGICGFIVYFLFVIFDLVTVIYSVNQNLQSIGSVLEWHSSIIPSIALFALICPLLTSIFYVVLPIYFFRRLLL